DKGVGMTDAQFFGIVTAIVVPVSTLLAGVLFSNHRENVLREDLKELRSDIKEIRKQLDSIERKLSRE
ncbi:MAG: hypothetical protein ACRD4B_09185, partial [Acidobacteriota bacterium]